MLEKYPKFKKLNLRDKEEFDKYCSKFPPYSDFNFVSLWTYAVGDFCEVCMLNDSIVVKFKDYLTSEPFYSFLGNTRSKETIGELLKRSKKEGLKPELRLVPEVNLIDDLVSISKTYAVSEDRDNHDYILSIEEISAVKGNRYYAKKNLMNRFIANYPNFFVCELDLSDVKVQKEVVGLFMRWAKGKNRSAKDIRIELNATKRLIMNNEVLKVCATGVYVKDRLVSYSFEEPVHDKHVMAHFGKSDYAYEGVVQFTERESAKYFNSLGYTYLNYEQDLGIEGLRKAKLLWHPIKYLRKFTVKEN